MTRYNWDRYYPTPDCVNRCTVEGCDHTLYEVDNPEVEVECTTAEDDALSARIKVSEMRSWSKAQLLEVIKEYLESDDRWTVTTRSEAQRLQSIRELLTPNEKYVLLCLAEEYAYGLDEGYDSMWKNTKVRTITNLVGANIIRRDDGGEMLEVEL